MPAAAPCARCRARRRCRATTCALSLDIRLQEIGGAGLRRPARRAGGDRARHRRHPGVRVQAGLRPQPLRRGHRRRQLGSAQRVARQAAAQPPAARRLSAGLDHQAVPGARRADLGQAHAAAVDQRPGLLPAPGVVVPVPRRQARRPRHRSTCTSRSSSRATRTTTCWRARPTSTTRRASCRSSASGARPASTSKASCRACCLRANGSARALPARSTATSIASGISATRSPPASARATTRSRRCSSRTRPRSSPTTAWRSGRTSSSTSST